MYPVLDTMFVKYDMIQAHFTETEDNTLQIVSRLSLIYRNQCIRPVAHPLLVLGVMDYSLPNQ